MIKQFKILLLLTFSFIIEHVLSEVADPVCVIPDTTQVHTYNFTELSSTDLTMSGEAKETIRLRLCSPLEKKCNERGGYSVCLTKDGKEIGIGKYPAKLRSEENGLYFNLTGDYCKPNRNYTVTIIMKCNYSVKGSSIPQLIPGRTDSCALQMLWETTTACVKAVTTNCSIVDKSNNRFDLSSLTMYSDNYRVALDKQGTSEMIINVCHSIIHETGAACASPVGACLSSDRSEPYMNMGDVEDKSLVIENDILKLKYRNGAMCDHNGSTLSNYQTTISFICDPTAIINTEPQFSNESKPCDYKFTWNTAAACPESKKCKLFVPETGNRSELNFQELMNRDFNVNGSDNSTYKFRICGPLLDEGCARGTGICNTKTSASAGTANFNLLWRHGGPYLNYTYGEHCGNGLKRYTLIAFVCGAEGSPNLPIVIKDEPCSLIINWYTDLACVKKRITCGQQQTNLTSLIRNDKNYVINSTGTEFHINICRPIVPTPGLACFPGSAVCRAEKNSKGRYTEEISLGFAEHNPVLDGDQNLILNYSNGSRCPENPKRNISSSFKFFCDFKGDVGLPDYKSYSNCNYVFEWRTNIVCGAVVGNWSAPCTIKDPIHPNELNLSSLYEKPVPRFVTTKDKNYSISICGGKEHCNGSAVCLGNIGYGTFSQVTFDYTSKLIRLQYSNGRQFPNEPNESEISLICNNTAGIGNPVLELDTNRSAHFKWQTAFACPKENNHSITSDPLMTTEKTSSIDAMKYYSSVQTYVVSSMLVLVILVIGMWLYLRNPQRCVHLRSRIRAIRNTKNQSRVQYSRVNTTEEARLLLDTSDPCTDGQIDSDDELLGV